MWSVILGSSVIIILFIYGGEILYVLILMEVNLLVSMPDVGICDMAETTSG